MKKTILLLAVGMTFSSCAELQQVANQLPSILEQGNVNIAGGLKEALNNGISKQVTKLTAVDGFYKNQMVKNQILGKLVQWVERRQQTPLPQIPGKASERSAQNKSRTTTALNVNDDWKDQPRNDQPFYGKVEIPKDFV